MDPATYDKGRDIRSAVLGETREVWVHLPQGWNSGERFDAVYVLDADAQIRSVPRHHDA